MDQKPDIQLNVFTILPAGLVIGGWGYYTLDLISMAVCFDFSLKIFGRPIDVRGNWFAHEQKLMRSKSVKVGSVFRMNDLEGKVTKVSTDHIAVVSVASPGIKLIGFATLDLSEEYIKLLSFVGRFMEEDVIMHLNIVRHK